MGSGDAGIHGSSVLATDDGMEKVGENIWILRIDITKYDVTCPHSFR